MTYKTLHGLKPANDFLNDAIRKDSGIAVTLYYKRTASHRDVGDSYHNYWIQRVNDPRLISFVPQGWQWKNAKAGPEDIIWPLFPLTIYPDVKTQHGLRRFVYFELAGLENVPGLTLKQEQETSWAWLAEGNSGYITKESPLFLEYRRRSTIEAADVLQKEVETRIIKHQILGPFMLD